MHFEKDLYLVEYENKPQIKQNIQEIIIPNNLSLAEKDKCIMHIEKQILAKRKMLLEKQNILKREEKQNEFLNIVRNDYKKYYFFIIKQKKDQVTSMEILQKYLDDLIVSGKLTDEDLLNAKKQHKHILGELNKVKNNLSGLVKETGYENFIEENKNKLT